MNVPVGEAELLLGGQEDLVPQPRLEVALQLGQIEGGRRALRQLRLGVVEDIEAEIEQRARHLLAVDREHGASGRCQPRGRTISSAGFAPIS